MSAASTPVPRSKYTSDYRTSGTRPSGSRYSLFWPMLIFLIGAGSLTFYQLVSMEDRYEETTINLDRLDPQVQKAQYEKTKFFTIARDILRLADKDPNAKQVAAYYKLPQLRDAQPDLMSMSTPAVTLSSSDGVVAPSTSTNAAPVTTVAPVQTPPIPAPAVK